MLLDDLKRRGVLRAGATYTVAALGLWGAVDLGAEALALPESVLRYTVIATVSGLPLVLVLAWFFNLRIERDTPLSPSDHPRIMGALAAGVGVAAVIFFVLSSATDVSSGNPPTVPGSKGGLQSRFCRSTIDPQMAATATWPTGSPRRSSRAFRRGVSSPSFPGDPPLRSGDRWTFPRSPTTWESATYSREASIGRARAFGSRPG